jgi:di/tricarboxylate transporter
MLTVFAILGCAVGLFAWGRPPTDVVGLLIVAALMTTGVLSPAEALAGFGSPVVILIAGIFVVSAGLVNAGVTQFLGRFIVRLGGNNETRLIAMIMLLAGGVGSVLNSSAIVAMFIPVVLSIAAKTGLNKKRLLMPLGIAVMISGMMPLIASSPNVIVENALRDRGVEPLLGFFSFTPFGVAALALALAFILLLGRNMLSRKRTAADEDDSPGAADLIAAYGLADRWHRLEVTAGSPLIGQSAAAARDSLGHRYDVDLLGLERKDHQRSHFSPADAESVIETDDVLFTLIDDRRIPEVTTALACSVAGAMAEGQRQKMLQDIGVAEVMPAPESKSLGVPLAGLDFPSAFNLTVLGIRHRGRSVTKDLPAHRLDFGDTVLVGGNWHDIHRLSEDRRNFLLLNLPAEYEDRLQAPGRAPVAIGILAVMVAAMAAQVLPNVAIALIAALAMIGTRCVPVEGIYRVISWRTLVVIAGMLPLATALTKTGATTMMADALVHTLGPLGPVMMLTTVFAVTALLCLFISNVATAVLIAPVAIQAAQTLHVSPQAFGMTVAIACSAAFVTPVSSPTNMLIMEPGGYRFGDYARVGLPMLLLTMVSTVILATLIYL